MSTAHTSCNDEVSEHPARHWKKHLLRLRSLQVVLSTLSSATGIFLLAVLVQVAEVLSSHNGGGESRYMSPAVGGLIAAGAIDVALSLLCLSLCLTWLVFTAAPNRRARSCGGNRVPCLRHSCDMGWDITWAVLWAISTILGCVTFSPHERIAAQVVIIFVRAATCGTFIATATISGKIRNRMRAGAAARDIEAASYSAEGATAAQQPNGKIYPPMAPADVVWPAKN